MNKLLMLSILLSSLSTGIAFADDDDERNYPKIYPFVPVETADVYKGVAKMTETDSFVKNVREIHKIKAYQLSKVDKQPWGSTYWPLNKGTIADPYTGKKDLTLFWQKKYKKFKERKTEVHPHIFDGTLSSEELSKLAPSEKYDLLLGDDKLDLTNKIWRYAHNYGYYKNHGFISKINWDRASIFDPKTEKYVRNTNITEDGYVLKKTSNKMALWEGICHGWSTASGNTPRPLKTVKIKLDGKNSGKTLSILPEDIKGLMAMFWANSKVQNTVLMEGLKCFRPFPKRDKWGRYYDHEADKYSKTLEPRCVGVHPAKWHLSVVNLIGKQQRSFVVERKIKSAVDNHPMTGYELKYFNPRSGDDTARLLEAMISTKDYKNDPFKDFRNPDAAYIMGVQMDMTYVGWDYPSRKKTDSQSDDKLDVKKMLYDLELDKNLNVIGGQWRAAKDGTPRLGRFSPWAKHNQPDFFWVIPKNFADADYMKNADLPEWKSTKSVPPKTWKQHALMSGDAHSRVLVRAGGYPFNICQMKQKEFAQYEEIRDQISDEKYFELINMVKNDGKPDEITVPCDFSYNYPQPLRNLVYKLLEFSRK